MLCLVLYELKRVTTVCWMRSWCSWDALQRRRVFFTLLAMFSVTMILATLRLVVLRFAFLSDEIALVEILHVLIADPIA